MKLRPYQNNFVTNIARKLFTGVRKVVAQLATGGGKTVCFAAISDRYIKKQGKKVLILVHRKELLQQTRKTAYAAFGLDCQPIIAGMKYIPPADIYVGMVETTWRRLGKVKGIGLVIIDECHRLEFAKFHEHFTDQYIIGFSATPLTASKKKPLNLYYEDIVCGIDIPDLISDKHLCQNITWAPKDVVERAELSVKGNEFDESIMAEKFSRPKYINNTVRAYERWGSGKKTLVFNVNIEHSLAVEAAFKESGYNVKHLDGETPSHERKQTLHWFSNTPDAILCNVNITTTGFDEPTIDTIIVNRATMSMPLWLQMCGRGSRPTGEKSAFTIVDMGANAITHGDWCQSRNWEEIFFHPPKANKETAGPVKSCPKCDAIIPAATKTCPYCGYVYPDKDIEVEAELYEFVMVTKGIDVDKVIKENKEKRDHYPFFRIGKDLAAEAKKTIPFMTDDYANFILQIYLKLARKWMQSFNSSRPEKPSRKFTKWYQVKAQEHLFVELKQQFPKWDTELISKDGKLQHFWTPNESETIIALTGLTAIKNM